MEKVFIVAAKRTPIGAFGGSLKNTSAGDLAAVAIKGALEAAKLAGDKVDEVIVGNVVGAGQGMGVGRQAALFAGIPESVPAYGVNMVCGSGMKTVMDAVSHIRSGDAEIVVAAGVEVMSQIPFAAPSSIRDGNKMGNLELKDLLVADGLTDVYNQYHMGVTAENAVKAHGLTPLAEIVSYAQSGLDPKIMGLGPVESVNKALAKAELTVNDIDVYELNEAFAAQALGVIHQLAETNQVPVNAIQDKANFNGGAIALGHPLGASGNRILVTLVHELHKQNGQYGVASLCVGGGMGTAVVVKAVK